MGRCSIVVAFLAFAIPLPAAERPVSGTPVKGFEPVEKAANQFMDRIDCQAMTIAISKDGEVVYSRGIGWRDAARKQPTQPDTLMRIASVSKPFTAATAKSLIRTGKLKPDSKVFDLLNLKAPTSGTFDARIKNITVQHLLEHKGGWDRDKAFDPMFRTNEAARALGLKKPATPADMVRWMLTQPLQFDPGEKTVYSNFGYCMLGRVIEKSSGKSYVDCVRDEVFKPAGIKDMKLGRNLSKDRDTREVWYPASIVNVEVMDAHGGFIASAKALCQFMDYFWIGGEPRAKGTGQNWTFFGSLPGTTAMARQRKDGYNIAVLCNNRRDEKYNDDNDELKKLIDAALDEMTARK